jgi:hypothetical protein
MKRILLGTAITGATILGVMFGAAVIASAADVRQLAASAGLSAAEAEGMSLSEIAAVKFNRETRGDYQQAVEHVTAPIYVDAARDAQLIRQAGLDPAEAEGLTLADVAAAKHNAGASVGDNMIVVVSTRGTARFNPQLAASAGLSPAEASGMSLSEIAAAKFARDTYSVK